MNQAVFTVNKSKDRLLPVQEPLLAYYKQDMNEYYERLHSLMMSFYRNSDKNLERFNLTLPEDLTYFQMGSDLPSLHFLQFIIRLCNYKSVLEIGTFIGVSAMHFAESAADVKVTTFEIGKQFADIAKRNIELNGFAERIKVIHTDAKDINAYINNETFDLIYLDGDKGNYCNLFKQLYPLLNKNGLMVIDDILFNGDALNDLPVTEKGIGVVDSLKEVANHVDADAFLLPLSNGKLLIRKP